MYYQDKPVSNMPISTLNSFKDKGYATKMPIREYFTADEAGFFHVKFIRRTGREDVVEHSLGLSNDTLYYNGINTIGAMSISTTDLCNAKENIQLGRIYLTRKDY